MKTVFFLIACFSLISCSNKNDIPEGIIQPKKMQGILWDVIRAQELSAEVARKDSTVDELTETKLLSQKVYDIHNITSSDFDKSYSWYTAHPEMMRIIFDSINAQNERQEDFRRKEGYKPFKPNSIKK